MFDIEKLEENKQKIQKDLTEFSPIIESITVTDQDSLNNATRYAGEAKKRLDRIEELRVNFKKPVLEFGKMIDTWAKNLSSPYEVLMDSLKGKMKKYHLEQERIAREAQERLRKEQEEQAKIAREQAEAEAKKLAESKKNATPEEVQDMNVNDLILSSAQAPTPQAIEVKHDSKSKTESGSSFTRKVWKFEITDEAQVPREFLTVNEPKIRESVKSGTRDIPGVRIYEDIDVSIRS